MTVVGIDLGTTNTVVAAARSGRAVALKDDAGRSLLPSVVSFHPNGEVLIGADAKERRTVDAQNTIFSIKRLIGRSWDSEQVQRARERLPFSMKEGPGKSTLVEARGHAYTLPEISAYVLERAKQIAEKRLGTQVEGCVITVPANFNDLQRAATKVAGRVAGLEVLRILNEPTAAALAYGFGKTGRERIAVYDFGGGTFDVTLLDLSENVFEVLATAGDTFLGGDDIDRVIADRMADQLLIKHRVDARDDVQLYERLRAAAETIKVDLSTQLAAKVTIPEVSHGLLGKALAFDFEMKRSELDSLTEPLVERTLEVCREALRIAGAAVKDFDQVLLVGGSTRSPLVRKKVGAFFGKPPQTRLNPDEVVALGAAIQATALGATRTASIPAPPMPAAGTRAPSPSWTNEASPRPKLGSIPPDTHLDSPARAKRASFPPELGRKRSEQSVLARLEAKPMTPLGAAPMAGIPGSIAPNTFAGVGPRGRLKTQSGMGPSPIVVPPAASLRAPPPLDDLSPPPAPPPFPPAPPPLDLDGDFEAEDLEELEPELEELDYEEEVTRTNIPSVPPLAPVAPAPKSVPPLAPAAHVPPKSFGATLPSATSKPITAPGAFANTLPSADMLPPLPDAGRDEPRKDRAALVSTPYARATLPGQRAVVPVTTSAPLVFELQDEEAEAAPHGIRSADMSFEAAPAQARAYAEPPRAPALDLAPVPKTPLLVDVTPLALGVEVVGGYVDTLIARNSPVPCEHSRAFVTANDDQTLVRVRVCQGQSTRFSENTVLGEVELSGLTKAPRGSVKIEVTFTLDESGILSVAARDAKTGAATRAQLKLIGL
jgi:molecular chaperone DnaK